MPGKKARLNSKPSGARAEPMSRNHPMIVMLSGLAPKINPLPPIPALAVWAETARVEKIKPERAERGEHPVEDRHPDAHDGHEIGRKVRIMGIWKRDQSDDRRRRKRNADQKAGENQRRNTGPSLQINEANAGR